jgi:hypothetical protein
VFAAATILFGMPSGVAHAQDDDDDGEGGNRSLREQLDEAASKHEDAKVELGKSEKRELKLTVKLEGLEEERDELIEEIKVVAAAAYRTGRVGAVTALINSTSPTSFLERAAAVDMIAKRDAQALGRFAELSGEIEAEQSQLAEEIATQEKELEKLEGAKDQAEQALLAIGGGADASFEPYASEDATPAPRNSDGSLPGESCSEDDPTTTGCVSPRMLHAYNEAQVFGFSRYTSCFRGGTFGEHPAGRACDFAASVNGFGGVATGGDKAYGDRLASFLVHNADAFGVQYVIWYRQIWFPATGWRSYGSGDGTPAGDHTNHVHLSVH